MRAPDISILIATYNRKDLVQACLDRVFELAPTEPPFEVIVVDNASTDGTAEMLEAYPNPIVLVRNSVNRNFSGANNQAAELARGDWLVMLNADTLPEAGWLQALLAEAKLDPKIGVTGCKLLYPEDRTVQHAGVAIGEQNHPFHIYRKAQEDSPIINHRRELQSVTAACWIVPTKLYRELGGFDERYVNGFEDVDFCFRVREAGLKVFYTHLATVLHFEGASPGRNSNNGDNWQIFRDRWEGKYFPDILMIYARDGLRAIPIKFNTVRLISDTAQRQFEINYVWDLINHQQYELAAQQLQIVKEKYPDEFNVREFEIKLLIATGHLVEAIDLAEMQSASLPIWYHAKRTITLAKRAGQLERATHLLTAWETKLEEDEDRAEWWALRGDVFAKQSDWVSAGECYQNAAQLRPTLEEVMVGKANILLAQSKAPEAEYAYLETIHRHWESSRAHLGLALSLLMQGRKHEALDAFVASRRYDPTDLNCTLYLVSLAQELGQLTLAEKTLQDALKRMPNHTELMLFLGSTKASAGDRDGAKDISKKILKINPGDQGAKKLLAWAESS